MEYRELGDSGLRVSAVGVGAWQFGGEWGKDYAPAEVEAILDRAAGLGINLVDTAECYGDHLSERLVGRALRGSRDRWVVATKFGHRYERPFARAQEWTPAAVVAQLEASLRALGTDRVDLYQFHSGGDPEFFQDALWDALARQVEAGKIRHLGVSISSGGDRLRQVEAARAYGIRSVQLVYNRLERGPEEAVLPACRRDRLGVLARVPLASGYLSGKYRPGDRFPPGDVRSTHDPASTAAKLKEVEAIREREVPAGMGMAAWALAWCLRNPDITCVIPGCKDVAQVEANAAAAAIRLP